MITVTQLHNKEEKRKRKAAKKKAKKLQNALKKEKSDDNPMSMQEKSDDNHMFMQELLKKMNNRPDVKPFEWDDLRPKPMRWEGRPAYIPWHYGDDDDIPTWKTGKNK